MLFNVILYSWIHSFIFQRISRSALQSLQASLGPKSANSPTGFELTHRAGDLAQGCTRYYTQDRRPAHFLIEMQAFRKKTTCSGSSDLLKNIFMGLLKTRIFTKDQLRRGDCSQEQIKNCIFRPSVNPVRPRL